ncbi:motility accessory factor [Campylobacter lari]|uniref:motility associated factor glycosyltransferase family protein n=1 Tax=Campylobacter lari TaxID=201 RepID=UPI00397867E0
MNTFLKNTQNLYKNHPVLFIYGLGNYIKNLFQNEKLKYLVIFEEDKNTIDNFFQQAYITSLLKENKLFIFNAKEFDFNKAKDLFLQQNFMFYSKIVQIIEFKKSYLIQTIENNIHRAIESILNGLQSSQECEVYIEHFCKNLPKILSHSSTQNFLNTHKAKQKYAIIVASGPSLIKQLPLLKKIQNKVNIFCADGSYTILHKYGIKPDYVFCIERDFINGKEEKTGSWIFFDNNFGSFDDNILFILSDTTHPKIIKLLENNNRNYIITLSINPLSTSFEFHDFGYCDLSFNSVANLAYNFAVSLEYKNIILIGQDLAFGKDGNSHPKEFLHGAYLDSSHYKHIKTIAYGGKGEVFTQAAWLLYKEKYEYDINLNKHIIKTYNATEGGAKIEGAIEKPFKELCDKIIKENTIKQAQMLPLPDKHSIYTNLQKTLNHFKIISQTSKNFLDDSKKIIKKIQNISLQIDSLPKNLSLEESLKIIDFNQINILQKEIKLYKEKLYQNKYFSTILLSYMYANECNFIHLECLDINIPEKIKINQLTYIINHERHIKEIINLIEKQHSIIIQTTADIQELISKDFS